jgi:hypothetical protein
VLRSASHDVKSVKAFRISGKIESGEGDLKSADSYQVVGVQVPLRAPKQIESISCEGIFKEAFDGRGMRNRVLIFCKQCLLKRAIRPEDDASRYHQLNFSSGGCSQQRQFAADAIRPLSQVRGSPSVFGTMDTALEQSIQDDLSDHWKPR